MSTRTPGHSGMASEPGPPELHGCIPHVFYPVPKSWASPVPAWEWLGAVQSPTAAHQHQAGSLDSWADRIPGGGSKTDDNCIAFPFWKAWMMMLSLRCSAERTDLVISRVVGFFSEDFQEKLDFGSFLGGTLTIWMQMWKPNLPLTYIFNKSLDLILMKANSCSRWTGWLLSFLGKQFVKEYDLEMYSVTIQSPPSQFLRWKRLNMVPLLPSLSYSHHALPSWGCRAVAPLQGSGRSGDTCAWSQ